MMMIQGLMTKGSKLVITAFLSGICSLALAQEAAPRIAFVNAEKIFVESNMAKAAQSRLQNEFANVKMKFGMALRKLRPLQRN